jgi:hypothetical protein
VKLYHLTCNYSKTIEILINDIQFNVGSTKTKYHETLTKTLANPTLIKLELKLNNNNHTASKYSMPKLASS